MIVQFSVSPPLEKPSSPPPPGLVQPSLGVGPGHWVKGSRDETEILVEYSDFQCPACRAYDPLVKQLYTKLGDQLFIVYRHYSLTNIHVHAQLAAQVQSFYRLTS